MSKPRPIDTDRVLQLASSYCTVEEIAADQDCSKSTLERRCDALIKRGRELAKRSLRARQFQLAMGTPAQYSADGKQTMPAIAPSVTMLIWLGKQYLGQADKFDVKDGSGDGFEFVDPG